MNDFTPLEGWSHHRVVARHSDDIRRTSSRRHGLSSLSFSLAALAVVLASTACGGRGLPVRREVPDCPADQRQSPQTDVLTMTATSAEPRVALPDPITTRLTEAGRTQTGCLLVVPPDAPAWSVSLTPRRPNGDVENGTHAETARRKALGTTVDRISGTAATAPGLDVRNAMARVVRAHPQPGSMTVVTSGGATVPPVTIDRLGWNADGIVVGRFLRDVGWLDLTGWDVTFVGLGRTGGSQPELSEPTRRLLVVFWLDVCRGAGARRCTSIDGVLGAPAPLSTNTVPRLQPPDDPRPPGCEDTGIGCPPPAPPPLPADRFFELDSAVLSHDADDALSEVVATAVRLNLKVSVTGYADARTGTPAHNLRLSRERAHAVANRLRTLGLPESLRGTVVGVGDRTWDGVEPTDEDAALHRKVEIRWTPLPDAPAGTNR